MSAAVYHYTKETHLPSIFRQGLKAIPAHLEGVRSTFSILHPKRSRAAFEFLWFTTNPVWERTVFVDTAPSIHEAVKFAAENECGRLIRIACAGTVAPLDWKEVKSNLHHAYAKVLYASAVDVGAKPKEWRATRTDVPVSAFLAIDVYDGSAWVPYWEELERAA